MNEDPGVDTREGLLRRICGEYMEMPGLRLTRAQAQRLWGIDEQICASLLEFLVEGKFLQRTGDGRFARLTDGVTLLPPLQMAKARLDPDVVRPKKSDTPTAA